MNKADDFKGVHHAYLGLFLSILGFLFIWVTLWVAIPLLVVGVWLFIDDACQHIVKRFKPEYQSPAHRLFGVFYKWKWIRDVTAWFDKRLGR